MMFILVVRQGPHIGPSPDFAILRDVSFKAFEKLVRKEEAKLPNQIWNDPVGCYWRTINNYHLEKLKSVYIHDSVSGIPLIPDDFVGYYGMQMHNVAGLSDVIKEADTQISTEWIQHSTNFCGNRNFLLQNNPASLQGIASPYSYIYHGTSFTSFPHHFEVDVIE